MIDIQVSNFRGVASGAVTLDRVALVAGVNGQGKSSFAQAAQAALTGNFAPGLNVRKNEATRLIHRGASEGAAKVTYPDGHGMVRWPSTDFATAGKVPSISGFAAGFTRYTAMTDKDRAAILGEYLQTTPSKAELSTALAAALTNAGLKYSIEEVTAIVTTVENEGYDIAEKRCKDAATRAKGAWGATTGANYGSKIALTWMPEGYDQFSLQSSTPEALKEAIQDLQERHKVAVGRAAVAAVDTAPLEESAKLVPGQEEKVAVLQSKYDAAAQAQVDHASNRPPEPARLGQPPKHCPHCDGEIDIVGGELRKAVGGPTQEEIDAQQQKLTEWQDEGARLRDEARKLQGELSEAKSALAKSQSDAKRLTDIKANQGADGKAEKPETLEADIKAKQEQMAAIEAYNKARKYAADVVSNTAIADVLAPDGIRKQKLQAGLSNINNALASMAQIASWKAAFIADDLSVRYGEFPFEVCSESEKYRANLMLQLAFAHMDSSPVCVIDAADILDANGKNGLFALLQADNNRSFLVCMTVSTKDKVPNLARFGMGKSYWIEGGTIKELE